MNIEDIDKIILSLKEEIRRQNDKIEILQHNINMMSSVVASGDNAMFAPSQMPITDWAGKTEFETSEDCHTTRGFIYAIEKDKIGWTEFSWTRLGVGRKEATPGEASIPQSGEKCYVVVSRTDSPFLSINILENLSSELPSLNTRVLATVYSKYNDATALYEIDKIERHHVGDILDVDILRNHAFKFTPISDTTGILTPGRCWIAGKFLPIWGMPSEIVVSKTTCYWVEVDLYNEYAQWKSGDNCPPEGQNHLENYPILKIEVEDNIISEVIQYQTSDIHGLYRQPVDPGSAIVQLGSDGEHDEEVFEDGGHTFNNINGVEFWVTTRVVYNHERSQILYGYQRKIVIDKRGNIYQIGPEKRYEIDVAVPEP